VSEGELDDKPLPLGETVTVSQPEDEPLLLTETVSEPDGLPEALGDAVPEFDSEPLPVMVWLTVPDRELVVETL